MRLLGRVSVALTLCLLLPLVFRPTLPWTLGERLLALAALATLLLYAGLFLFFLLSVFLLLYCRLAVPWAVPTSAFAFTLLAQIVLRFGELHTHSFEQLSTMSVWALAVNLVFLFSLFFARPDGSGDLDRSSRPAPDFLAQLLRCLEHLRRRLRE